MDNFCLRILGSGSALPTRMYNQASQFLDVHEKSFLIDCGEGTQRQMRNYNVRLSRLNHIFISHLHGDHCFGLIGLLSTLGMMERTADLYIHSHPDLETLLQPLINFFCQGMSYKIIFEPFCQSSTDVLYEDRSMIVSTFPLKHKMPSSGFLFKEKPKDLHIRREMVDFYKIPIKMIPLIKQGADFITDDGETVMNAKLTTPSTSSKSFAYCSDTMYAEKIIPYIENADCLFHEATFLHEHLARAKVTMHSTAFQAATIAKMASVKQLIIGHYSARYDKVDDLLAEAKSVFDNTYLSEDGRLFRF